MAGLSVLITGQGLRPALRPKTGFFVFRSIRLAAKVTQGKSESYRGGRERDGRIERGDKSGARLGWRHEALEFVSIAARVLREDGARLEASTAHMKHECLLRLDGLGHY